MPMDMRWLCSVRRFAIIGFVVVGAGADRAHAADFDEVVERYRAHIVEDIGQALAGARALRDCLATNDVEGAKKAWMAARGGWERSEVFTSGLVPELDEKIDAWPKATTGFHAIEAKLFGAGRTDVASETDALIADLAELDSKIRDMPLPPQDLLNGAARLAYEIGESKSDGGESRVSGTSLDDMRNNVSGIRQAYHTIFAAALAASDPALAATTESEIEALNALLAGPSLDAINSDRLRKSSEEFVVTLASAAPKINLQKPVLEDLSK
ncbi:EfeM/EfeO family lipoprotein [Methylocapsa polymorpha]|uniref:EfeM/EfeO family lipoprotein n=1 Tax=Methylocapsa polymorpha TaxID=3080828 RepID=A0ABZ0HVP8_9HYPH|nr:EfeM/EfeO family lipoprotein [Methylocapsa sp. RX1]